jgi:hypothetical protein
MEGREGTPTRDGGPAGHDLNGVGHHWLKH